MQHAFTADRSAIPSSATCARLLAFLFKHQLQAKYRYAHDWRVGDVLMCDNIGTIHNAVADYRPDEPRLIKRCQVMADRIFGAAA